MVSAIQAIEENRHDVRAECATTVWLSSLLEDGREPLRDVVVIDISQDSRRVVAAARFSPAGAEARTALRICVALERGAAAVLWEPAPVSSRRRFHRRWSVHPRSGPPRTGG